MRNINIKNKNEFKAILMKNAREELAIIPNGYFKGINYSFYEVDELEIEIPKLVKGKNGNAPNILYNQFKGKRQQIITELNGKKSRWVVSECEKNDIDKCKNIKAKSFESVLNEIKFPTENITRQLYYKEGDNDIADGILNFFETDTGWKVGEVSENARKQWDNIHKEIQLNLAQNYENSKVQKESVLFEKDVDIQPYNELLPINLKICYDGFSIWEKEDKPSTTQKFQHTFDNLHTGVKHIKIEFLKGKEYSDAFLYTFTLKDDLVVKYEKQAPYLKDLKLTIKSLDCNYTTGELVDIYATKYRSFNEGIYQWYDFLMNDISKAYNVIFTFDTYNKIINCYDEKDYGREIPLQLRYDNYIKSINKKEQYDEIINKLYVKGKEKVSISEYNPIGTEYIYDYTYMIENEIMSEELVSAWKRYTTHCNTVSVDLIELRLELNTINRNKIKIESEIKALDENIRGLESIRNGYMKADDKPNVERMSKEINEKKDKYEQLLKDLQVIKDNIASKNEEISKIMKSINLETAEDKEGKIFDELLLSELNDITICKDLQDESYTTNYGLYNHAVEYLREANICPIEFDIDIVGFLEKVYIPSRLTWDYYLNIGDLIEIKDEDLNNSSEFEGKVRIIKFKYYPSSGTVDSIELTNKKRKFDGTSKIGDLGRAISSSNYIIKSKQEIINDSKNVNEYMKKLELYGNDLAYAIKSKSMRCKFNFSEAGLFLIDGENEDSQICLTGALISITKDRWNTLSTCIDESGIYARELIGQVILGKKLYIVSEDGKSLFIGEKENDPNKGFGIVIKDDDNTERIFLGTELVGTGSSAVRKARLRLKGKDGELALSEDGILNPIQWSDSDNVSPNYPMTIMYRVPENVSRIKKCTLTLLLEQFRGNTRTCDYSGDTQSTSDGGGATTSNSDPHRHAIGLLADDSEYATYKTGKFTVSNTYDGYLNKAIEFKVWARNSIENVLPDALYTATSNGVHNHWINSHFHTINLIHNHLLKYGIHVSTMPSGIKIEINGAMTHSNLNDNFMELDITSHIKLNTLNIIKIHSNTNGRVNYNLASNNFTKF